MHEKSDRNGPVVRKKNVKLSIEHNINCDTSQLKYVFRLEENVSRAVDQNSLTP